VVSIDTGPIRATSCLCQPSGSCNTVRQHVAMGITVMLLPVTTASTLTHYHRVLRAQLPQRARVVR